MTQNASRSSSALACVILTAAVLTACTAHENHPCCTPTTSTPTTSSASPLPSSDVLGVGETPWWQVAPTHPAAANVPPSAPPTQRYTLEGGVIFEPDSAALTPGASSQLGVVLDVIRSRSASDVAINGYTNDDGGPAAGAFLLSRQRADAVRGWLVAHGVPPSRITTHGWGDTRPVYPHPTNEAQRAANRRCTITITAGSS
jgi:outer membrane protein OmpA-like peptidoglycan-associated protein